MRERGWTLPSASGVRDEMPPWRNTRVTATRNPAQAPSCSPPFEETSSTHERKRGKLRHNKFIERLIEHTKRCELGGCREGKLERTARGGQLHRVPPHNSSREQLRATSGSASRVRLSPRPPANSVFYAGRGDSDLTTPHRGQKRKSRCLSSRGARENSADETPRERREICKDSL